MCPEPATPHALAADASHSTAPATPPEGRRWSRANPWNRPLSWELILRITPRLPRPILVSLHHVTTAICMASMGRERRAVRRNLERITGATGWPNARLAYRLFYNFSRFMVAYTEIASLPVERFRDRLVGAEGAEVLMRELLAEGRGLIVVTMHLGHWDLGLKLLTGFSVPVNVVMLSEDPEEVTRYANAVREQPGLRVHQVGSSPMVALDLASALGRGEIVAVQADRPVGRHVRATRLFGADTDLPMGPVQLAAATGAPMLPVFVLFDEGNRYRILTRPPLRLGKRRREGSDATLSVEMREMAAMMESVIAPHADQWFNFYDVWADGSRRQRRSGG